jgi:hypothetical protein
MLSMRQDVRMTSTATNTCIEITGCHFMAGHLSDLLQEHTSASTL